MGRSTRIGIALNVMKFQSKIDCRHWIETALHKYKYHIPISYELEPFMYMELDAFLNYHPDQTKVRGVGIDSFFIANDSSNCIYVKRHDQTYDKFSYVHTLKCAMPTITREAMSAMYLYVEHDCMSFIKKSVYGECGRCGSLTKDGDRTAEYAEPYEELCKKYILTQGWVPKAFSPRDGTVMFTDDDRQWCEDWKKFHMRNAVLRIVCRECITSPA